MLPFSLINLNCQDGSSFTVQSRPIRIRNEESSRPRFPTWTCENTTAILAVGRTAPRTGRVTLPKVRRKRGLRRRKKSGVGRGSLARPELPRAPFWSRPIRQGLLFSLAGGKGGSLVSPGRHVREIYNAPVTPPVVEQHLLPCSRLPVAAAYAPLDVWIPRINPPQSTLPAHVPVPFATCLVFDSARGLWDPHRRDKCLRLARGGNKFDDLITKARYRRESHPRENGLVRNMVESPIGRRYLSWPIESGICR